MPPVTAVRLTPFFLLFEFFSRAEKALWCLSPGNFIRRHALLVAEDRRFELFILVVILCNCVALAVWDPTDDDDNPSTRNEVLVRGWIRPISLHTLAILSAADLFLFISGFYPDRNKSNTSFSRYSLQK